MLDNQILTKIQDAADEFYPSVNMLKQYKNQPNVPFGFLMCVTLRAKIYENTKELIRKYKKQEPHADLLNRVLKELKLHRYQIKKLNQTHPNDRQSVHRFCIGLATLLYTAFGRQIQSRDI